MVPLLHDVSQHASQYSSEPSSDDVPSYMIEYTRNLSYLQSHIL